MKKFPATALLLFLSGSVSLCLSLRIGVSHGIGNPELQQLRLMVDPSGAREQIALLNALSARILMAESQITDHGKLVANLGLLQMLLGSVTMAAWLIANWLGDGREWTKRRSKVVLPTSIVR